ncbi:MAG TPA: hypothetical protein VMY35_17635 [Phycisphaerae bacterium]|nr:hypothetical protein [Phycisphaerae bacterium]
MHGNLRRRAGNFIVDGPNGPISVTVSDANARQLATDRRISRDGRTFWVCPMEGFYTVAVEEDGLNYCAVGDDAPEHLVDLLDGILSAAPASQRRPVVGLEGEVVVAVHVPVPVEVAPQPAVAVDRPLAVGRIFVAFGQQAGGQVVFLVQIGPGDRRQAVPRIVRSRA